MEVSKALYLFAFHYKLSHLNSELSKRPILTLFQVLTQTRRFQGGRCRVFLPKIDPLTCTHTHHFLYANATPKIP